MTVQGISWVLDYSQTGANDRLVMITLGHHSDEDGHVGVSRARIAAETRLSQITVKRILDRLCESTDELEEVDAKKAPDWWRAIPTDRRPRLFRLPLFAASRTGVQNEPPVQNDGGARRGRDGVRRPRSDQGGRDAIDEGSISNPSNESEAPALIDLTGLSLVEQVFNAWTATRKANGRVKLDAKRERLIANALKGYPLEDVLDAVQGWTHDRWHRDRDKNDLGYLLRDAEHIEKFRDLRRRSTRSDINSAAQRAQPTGKVQL